jgi:hypothetical protein
VTPEAFSEWRDNEITQEFFKWISQTASACELAWHKALDGSIPDEQLAIQRARLSERMRLAAEIINVELEDLSDDGKPLGDSSE